MLVIEQAAPGDDETTLKRVPQHRIVGEAERFGQCPASLMVIPLDAYSRDALKTQAQAMSLMLKPPADPPAPVSPASTAPTGGIFPVGRPRRDDEHPLTPHPDEHHPWFRWTSGGGTGGVNVPQHGKAGQGVVPLPDEPHAGPGPGRASKPHQPTADDVKTVIVDPPARDNQPQRSTAGMSTVEEVKAAISAAGATMTQAIAALAAAEEEISSAARLLDFIRQTSVDPMGFPQAMTAIERLGEAMGMLRASVEAGESYKASL